MSQIVFYALGDWDELPPLGGAFELELEAADEELRREFLLLAPEAGFTGAERRALGRARSLITASLFFEAEAAQAASGGAELLRALFQEGAVGVIYEGAEKLFAPTIAAEIEATDRVCLLHLYLSLWGEPPQGALPGRVVAEGLEAFGLPDVWILTGQGEERALREAAQSAAFAAAARLWIEGERFPLGAQLRASESKPLFICCTAPEHFPVEERTRNPHGVLCFVRAAQHDESP